MSEQMISDIDKDGSGSIDFEEFLDMMYVLVVEVLIQDASCVFQSLAHWRWCTVCQALEILRYNASFSSSGDSLILCSICFRRKGILPFTSVLFCYFLNDWIISFDQDF